MKKYDRSCNLYRGSWEQLPFFMPDRDTDEKNAREKIPLPFFYVKIRDFLHWIREIFYL